MPSLDAAASQPAEVRLTILPPRFAFRRLREWRVASGAAAPRVDARLAQPGTARVAVDAKTVMGFARRGRGVRARPSRWRGRRRLLGDRRFLVLRHLRPRSDRTLLRLPLLRLPLGEPACRDPVRASPEDLQRDLELLCLERPEVQF